MQQIVQKYLATLSNSKSTSATSN